MNSRTTLVLRTALALMCLVSTRSSIAQEKWALCKPVETASFTNRVHVRCEIPVDGQFVFFAASTQDPRFASRMLNLSMVGQVSERTLSILFDPNDQSGVAFGCQANGCRNAHAVALTESAAPMPPPPGPAPTPQPSPSPTPAPLACVAACNVAEGDCMGNANSVGQRQACIAEKRKCVALCK
jgi:hypothetical protein